MASNYAKPKTFFAAVTPVRFWFQRMKASLARVVIKDFQNGSEWIERNTRIDMTEWARASPNLLIQNVVQNAKKKPTHKQPRLLVLAINTKVPYFHIVIVKILSYQQFWTCSILW